MDMISVGFMLVGALFAVVGACFIITARRRSGRCTETAVGTVVGFEELHTRNTDGSTTQTRRPVIRYRVDGKNINSGPKAYTNSKKLNIGDTVTVYYDPHAPKKLHIKDYGRPYLLGIVFLIVGGAIVIFALL